MIDNLELKRAAHAIKACQKENFGGAKGGEVVKKLPPMIRESGLLGALAFALSKSDNDGHLKAFDTICRHLNELGKVRTNTAAGLLEELIEDSDSLKLRDVTAETLLYLNYLRRFAENKTGTGPGSFHPVNS